LPGKNFPAVSDDDRCVLRQQPFGSDAVARFSHFKELVESKAQNESVDAEKNYSAAVKT
jgi:hypothetical protein